MKKQRLEYYKKKILNNLSLEEWMEKRSEFIINNNKEVDIEKLEYYKKSLELLNYIKNIEFSEKEMNSLRKIFLNDIEMMSKKCLNIESQEGIIKNADYTGIVFSMNGKLFEVNGEYDNDEEEEEEEE